MTLTKIEGLELYPLQAFEDERGKLLKMVQAGVAPFTNCGEVYFSFTNPGVIKGWKRHKRMTQLMSCPVGKVRMVFFDGRPGSKTHGALEEIDLSPENHRLLKIPPQLTYAFKALSSVQALIVNCPDLAHEEGEAETFPLESGIVPYQWP